MEVLRQDADGGIIFSASHNPEEWNALKLLNGDGEFLSPAAGERVIEMANAGEADPVRYDAVGTVEERSDALDAHIDAILALDVVDPDRIAAEGFTVVVDGVNSVGGVALPRLLERLGVNDVVCMNCDPTGRFAHPAEPRPEHLTGLTERVVEEGADLGLAVDPDADRLALVDDRGRFVLEELTQVIAADFWWGHREGPFVTNLSSSRAIDDVAERHGESVYRSAVGEINVVERMREVGAVLGGEGNGGVIVPELHHGRDALAGTALVLQHLAERGQTLGEVHDALPHYVMAKDKVPMPDAPVADLLDVVAGRHADADHSTLDGLKISFSDRWVHMRPSNTEPVLRVYAEAPSEEEAHALTDRFKEELRTAAEEVEA
jgi:phosphomannomutase